MNGANKVVSITKVAGRTRFGVLSGSFSMHLVALVIALPLAFGLLSGLTGCSSANTTSLGGNRDINFISPTSLSAGSPLLKERNLLVFFASWCLECRMEMPALAQLRALGGSVLGVAVYDRQDNLQSFLINTGVTFPVVLDRDGDLARDFGLGRVPYAIAIDSAAKRIPVLDPSSGRLVDSIIGGRDWLSRPFIEWLSEKESKGIDESSSHP